jgi:hypothetical protein
VKRTPRPRSRPPVPSSSSNRNTSAAAASAALITGCSTWHEHRILTGSGAFVLSRESLTTLGGSGPGETFVAPGSYPPDQHGTYAVEKGARIKLSFADGSTKVMTFAYILNKEGKPDPTSVGVLLGAEYFTFANDE